jgi:hypothetical protein
LLFIGCDSKNNNEDKVTVIYKTAQLIDSPVIGIDYACSNSSTNGTTNENGTFQYDVNCDTITFSIGGVTVYSTTSVPSDEKLYITDLVGVVRTDTNNSTVLNISRFLQSLDDNNNPYDGINITNDVKISLNSATLDLSANPTVTDLNTTLTNLGKTLISESDAVAHFTYTLNSDLSLDIDSPPPPAPVLTSTPLFTNTNLTSIEINGQPATKIFINGIDTNITIPITSKILYALDTSSADGLLDFNITLRDDNLQDSIGLLFSITKDIISPIITGNNDINLNENIQEVINIIASDINALAYSLTGSDVSLFKINSSSGEISFLSPGGGDYEFPLDQNQDNIYYITVNVFDGVNTTSNNLTIYIANIAEIAPIITSFTGNINENEVTGFVLGTISFDKGDTNISDFYLYETNGSISSIFDITIDGAITLIDNSNLDYDDGIKSYSLTSKAVNDFGISNVITININVNDLIDVSPILTNFVGSVNENTQEGIIIGNIFIATTGDSTISTITLSGTNSAYFTASTTGVLRVSNNAILDYETRESYNLSAIATNTNGASNSVDVNITVLDVPEVVPNIEALVLSLDENISDNSSIGFITVIDNGDSDIISYSISGIGAGNFDVNTLGSLSINSNASIDFETTEKYLLGISASNLAGESRTVNLTISINNIYDVLPELDNFITNVNENETAGISVGTLPIIVVGDSKIISIRLLNSKDQNSSNFSAQTNGEMIVKSGAVLDYESNTSIVLTAIAVNQFGESNSANITININNLAETPPVIQALTTSIDENATIGTGLDTITVIDEGDESIIQFLLTGTGAANFDINGSGFISLKAGAVLDYETTSFYSLEAVAKTITFASTSVNILINVHDIPEVVPSLFNTIIEFDENTTINSIIGQININNIGDSNITSYTLSGIGEGNFSINNVGLVSLNNTISYDEFGSNTFDLNLYATNTGGNSLDANLTINVNEIPTQIAVLNNFTTTINEGLPKVTLIGQILIDSGDTVIQSINITSDINNHGNNFDISQDGTITVSNPASLVYETQSLYTFNVEAINAIGTSNSVLVTISVLFLENLEIYSAVYDNNNTSIIIDDDTLYLYFSKTVNESSFSASPSDDISIQSGVGQIGSSSTTSYLDSPYHLYTIKADSASGSLALEEGASSIQIKDQTLYDENGLFPKIYTLTTVESFKNISSTGQLSSYDSNGNVDGSILDDNYYSKGRIRNFVRDNMNEYVEDHTNNLIWQDNGMISTVVSWSAAVSYCQNLSLDSLSWELPTKNQLRHVFDKSNYDSSLDDAFNNRTIAKYYWTSSISANDSSKAWIYFTKQGYSSLDAMDNNTRYVKCVHVK